MDRRSFVSRLAPLALAAACARPAARLAAASTATPRRRLLCHTRSAGFVHSVVKPAADGGPSLVDRTVTALGQRDDFDVTCTRDGAVFTADGLRPFNASNRHVTHGPQKVDPYIAMIGAEFIAHGAQQTARVRVADARFPAWAASPTARRACASGTRARSSRRTCTC